MSVFYAGYVMIGYSYLEWLQVSINVLIGLFRRFRLIYNIKISKTMTCQPGAIHTGMSEEEFSQSSKVERGIYQERLQQPIP